MKKRVAVIFGGQSSEHDVSCVSAANVIDGLREDKYDTELVLRKRANGFLWKIPIRFEMVHG